MDLNRQLALVPKGLLALIAIVVGIFFVVLSSPPHTVCDSQLELFRSNEQHFLFLDQAKRNKIRGIGDPIEGDETTKYLTLYNHCLNTNTPGGCYELFYETRTLLRDLSEVPDSCAAEAGDIAEVKKAIWGVEDLLVRLGWGEKPPGQYSQKFGWLDTADLSLFCKLKHQIITSYEEEAWENFRESQFKSLPGAKDLTREEVWDLSLFSENCAKYP
jgi:hypothetical protein